MRRFVLPLIVDALQVAPRRGGGTRSAIQVTSDLPRGLSVDVTLEDAADDGGLLLLDLQLAWTPSDRPVPVGSAAWVATVANNPRHAALGVGDEVVQEQRAHQAFKAGMQLGDVPVGARVDFDAEELEALAQLGSIAFAARQPVNVLSDDHVELLLLGVRQHAREFWPAMDGRSGGGVVRIDRRHGPPAALHKGVAQRDLVVDRAVALTVR